MTKASEKLAAKTEARETLVTRWKDDILKPSTLTEFRTEYVKGSDTDYVSVHIYYIGTDGRLTTQNVTPLIAQAWNMRMRKSNTKHQLAISGGGLSKSYGVALKLFEVLGVEHRETDINFTY